MEKKAKESKEKGRLRGRDAIDDYMADEEKQALELMWQEVRANYKLLLLLFQTLQVFKLKFKF